MPDMEKMQSKCCNLQNGKFLCTIASVQTAKNTFFFLHLRQQTVCWVCVEVGISKRIMLQNVSQLFLIRTMRQTQIQISLTELPVIVVEYNAWLLCAFQSPLCNLLSSIWGKLAFFYLVAQEDHLVWLDGTVFDNGLLARTRNHP